MTRTSHAPAKPTFYRSFRPANLCSVATVGLGGMWAGAANVLANTPAPIPAPDGTHLQLATYTLGALYAGSGVVAGARYYHWLAADEARKVYESIARILKLPAYKRSQMKVRARDRLVPVDVIVRVQSVADAHTDRVQKSLVRAFADATGQPVARVRVQPVKRGVRLWVEKSEQHEPAGHAPPPAIEPEVATDAALTLEEAPEPGRPADDRTQDRIAAAMRGALKEDDLRVKVTDTHDDGAPSEVWIQYPPALTSSILGSLVSVRDTMERVHHARNDEWAVRWVSSTDRIVLTDRMDPLAPVVPLPPIEPDADLYRGVQIGVTENGQPWHIPLMGGPHHLVAGATGAGKGSILWGVIRGVSEMAAQGRVRLWVLDPKGGQELGELEGVAYRFAVDDDDCLKLLQDAAAALSEKAKTARMTVGRKIEKPTRELPLDLVIIDELASLTDNADYKVKNQTLALTSKIMRQGRSAAFTLLACTQDPRKEVVKNRSAYTAAVALRLSEAGETNLILQPGARAAGALADMIPEAHPGIGYVKQDGKAGYVRVRAAMVSDQEIDATVARMAPPMDPPQIGAPIARAEQPLLETHSKPTVSSSAGRPARITGLNTLPVRALFDGDPDPVTITEWRNSDEEEDRIVVTYHYDGEPERETDVDDGETVTVLP